MRMRRVKYKDRQGELGATLDTLTGPGCGVEWGWTWGGGGPGSWPFLTATFLLLRWASNTSRVWSVVKSPK